MFVHVCAGTCGDQAVLPQVPILFRWEHLSLAWSSLSRLGWPVSPRDPPVSVSPALVWQVPATIPGFILTWALRSSSYLSGRNFNDYTLSSALLLCLCTCRKHLENILNKILLNKFSKSQKVTSKLKTVKVTKIKLKRFKKIERCRMFTGQQI